MTNFSHVLMGSLRKAAKTDTVSCERTLDWKLSKLIKPRYAPQQVTQYQVPSGKDSAR